MIEGHLKQRRRELEEELEKQEIDEIEKALEEEGKVEVQRKKVEDEVDEVAQVGEKSTAWAHAGRGAQRESRMGA